MEGADQARTSPCVHIFLVRMSVCVCVCARMRLYSGSFLWVHIQGLPCICPAQEHQRGCAQTERHTNEQRLNHAVKNTQDAGLRAFVCQCLRLCECVCVCVGGCGCGCTSRMLH